MPENFDIKKSWSKSSTQISFNIPGTLKAILPLDYEQTPSEKFKIMVVDQSGHKCNSDIFLNLRDVNDNTPSFDQDLHTATVRENTSQSVVISQVNDYLLFKRSMMSFSWSSLATTSKFIFLEPLFG